MKMKKVYRYMFSNEDEYRKASQWIKEKNIITLQGGIHFGNCCLVRIPQDMIDTVRNMFAGRIDMEIPVFEQSDIEQFKAGDKVNLAYYWGDGAFCPTTNQRGKVHSVCNDEITILKGQSRKYGYRIRVGDDAQIEKLS
jgi:hypothetical protein